MTFVAFTQATAEWLLGKPHLLDPLTEFVASDENLQRLSVVEFVEGPFHAAASESRDVLAIWHSDYLSGTDQEAWGLIDREGAFGLIRDSAISREVLERELMVINQRLQGLRLDTAFIHRTQSNGAQTCIAGRGTAARHKSIAYFETNIEAKGGPARSLICVGPGNDFGELAKAAFQASTKLPSLVAIANSLISTARKKPVADQETFVELRDAIRPHVSVPDDDEYSAVETQTMSTSAQSGAQYAALGLSYDDWIRADSPLTEVQRRILNSDAIEHHPLRIIGPGGSGKTLLMQLLAVRRLRVAKEKDHKVRVLYIVHNAAMAETVKQRFAVLDPERDHPTGKARELVIQTLAEYGKAQLNLETTAMIDPDAFEAKRYQYSEVLIALKGAFAESPKTVRDSPLFSAVSSNEELFKVLAILVMAEISTAIKGHGLEQDRRRYVQSERPLSRLHGILDPAERELVFDAYRNYHKHVFEEYGVLDSDDIALSLLGRLRTPIWELKRKELGFDYVFVDETQLFNENERRVLPLLTNHAKSYVPIGLALDEAQNVYGQSTAGLATLGITGITNENLQAIHRSTRAIVKLAFFVIQRTTDLFGPDFPRFTSTDKDVESDTHALASPPRIERAAAGGKNIGKFVVKKIRQLRKGNVRSIAVICHADQYWDGLQSELQSVAMPLQILVERGQKIPIDTPVVVLTRPLFVGGHEFDAVIAVGLEQGVVPPRIPDNIALASAIEQQTLREIYLTITRARYQLIVVLSTDAEPTSVLSEAVSEGLLVAPDATIQQRLL